MAGDAGADRVLIRTANSRNGRAFVQAVPSRRPAAPFRNFPLNEAHSQDERAAEHAGAHGSFWPIHDGLYENQDQLGELLYARLATGLGLSGDDLEAALTAGTYRGRVRADFSGGVRSGVNGTPTFYINCTRHDGSFDFATLSAALTAAMT